MPVYTQLIFGRNEVKLRGFFNQNSTSSGYGIDVVFFITALPGPAYMRRWTVLPVRQEAVIQTYDNIPAKTRDVGY